MVDPNVFVSALISPTGSPALLVDAWKLYARYELVTSEKLVEELADVVERDKFRQWFPAEAGRDLVRDMRAKSSVVEEGPVASVSPDAKDDYLIALAAMSGADYLVSGDKPHLLNLEPGEFPPVVTPADMLLRL